MLGAYFIKLRRLPDRLAGQIHIGLRLHKKHLFAAYRDRGGQCLEAQLVYRNIKFLCHCVGRHKTGIVPCSVIFGAGVAEEYDKPCYTLRTAKSIKHEHTSKAFLKKPLFRGFFIGFYSNRLEMDISS